MADKTNGWKIFVSPKLFFGALIIGGITAVTVNSCAKVNCYAPPCYEPMQEDTIPHNDTITNVTCYDSAEVPIENQN